VSSTVLTSLERRVRELERRIEGLAPSNPYASRSSVLSTNGVPVAPSGLSLANTHAPGTIGITWNPVRASDVLYYEIQVAEDASFRVNPETFRETDPSFVFERGNSSIFEASKTFYLRVRSVNKAGRASGWSATLNSETGKVFSADIEPGATGEIYSFLKTSSFATLNTNNETEAYGPVVIDVFDATSVVEPRVIFEFDYASDWSGSDICRAIFTLEYRTSGSGGYSTVDSVTVDFKSTIPSLGGGTARAVAPIFTSFHQPGAGLWDYRVSIETEVTGGNAISITGVDLLMEFVQSKRTA
jgi:hypothetical protein